jgi:hypothetical protein
MVEGTYTTTSVACNISLSIVCCVKMVHHKIGTTIHQNSTNPQFITIDCSRRPHEQDNVQLKTWVRLVFTLYMKVHDHETPNFNLPWYNLHSYEFQGPSRSRGHGPWP